MKKEHEPTKAFIKQAEALGGTDLVFGNVYTATDQIPYFDKGGHKDRSIANDPKHMNHWKKTN